MWLRLIGAALAIASATGAPPIGSRHSRENSAIAAQQQDESTPDKTASTTESTSSSTPASSSASGSDATVVHFSGEVLRGQIYEHDIGHGMVFRLTPAVSDEGGGWVIGILPVNEPVDDPIEFAEIATPPYHAYNERFLAAAAGYSAREAVAVATRRFYFVQSVTDEHLANEVVNAALYPSAASEAEKARVAEEAAAVHVGSGVLRIVHSKITPGKTEPDAIAWVKFDVALNFSPGITMHDVLAPKPPAKR
jgi:hypothetical protein